MSHATYRVYAVRVRKRNSITEKRTLSLEKVLHANCIWRGIELPVLEMRQAGATEVESGSQKLVIRKTLYTSARSCSRGIRQAQILEIDMSSRRCGGPCINDSPMLPAVTAAPAEKTLVSNQRSTVRRSLGDSGFR